MLVKDFNFDLPPDLIANHPVPVRDSSRLMLLDRESGCVTEDLFRNISSYLKQGDLLVMNDTRVIPARILGIKESGGKAEIFLVRRESCREERWVCLLRASKKFIVGQVILLANDMVATTCSRPDAETWLIEFSGPEPFNIWLEREGHIPLPPYLQRSDNESDRERYQTVFSKTPGAVAAPTAGLHFTSELISKLELYGIKIAYLTLHTGLGTFQPVRVDNVEDHRIHTERYSIPTATAEAVYTTKAQGGRIIAVGTTTTRTLEYATDNMGNVVAGTGEADIFIYPGYSFKVVDGLITNFHLPESTLLMLVSAFAGSGNVLNAYYEAIRRRFRFYSYGDAMLIV
jgi:S-adenosylmethionine:tRNA ribosyltransferase-isomerase